MKKLLLILSVATLIVSCGDDDGDTMIASSSFTVRIENVSGTKTLFESEVFNTPVEVADPGPATPGLSYQFSFNAGQSHYLSFATMLVQSNDLFYAPAPGGIKLYDDQRNPLTGDITSLIDLWDAGTEVNQEPGVGGDQPPRQADGNTGMDESGTVELIANISDGFMYPQDEDVIQVTIEHDGGTLFTVTIANISDVGDFQTPLAPGVWAVHDAGMNALFEEGVATSNGLEGVAEDGDPTALIEYTSDRSGLVTPFAPGIWVVHNMGETPIFTVDQNDAGEGLEGLAEDGDPGPINMAVGAKSGVTQSGILDTPVGAGTPGPIFPGDAYEFTFTAEEGDFLNLATMLIQSNDLFVAFDDSGIPLFNNGMPITGDITTSLALWDAHTEVNEYPGAGNNQAPRQTGINTGMDEEAAVNLVSDSFEYPTISSIVQITISNQ